MRTIKRTAQFRRDLKRFRNDPRIEDELKALLIMLVEDAPLPAQCRDHALAGDMKGIRDCHVRPDIILLYNKLTDHEAGDILHLIRLGSHSELGI